MPDLELELVCSKKRLYRFCPESAREKAMVKFWPIRFGVILVLVLFWDTLLTIWQPA